MKLILKVFFAFIICELIMFLLCIAGEGTYHFDKWGEAAQSVFSVLSLFTFAVSIIIFGIVRAQKRMGQ